MIENLREIERLMTSVHLEVGTYKVNLWALESLHYDRQGTVRDSKGTCLTKNQNCFRITSNENQSSLAELKKQLNLFDDLLSQYTCTKVS